MEYSRMQMVRRLVTSGILLVFLQNVRAQFTFPVYETFNNYAENERLGLSGSSGNYWNWGNSVSDSSAVITSNSALTYPGLVTSPSAAPRGLRSRNNGKNRGANITPQQGVTLYASFLFQYITNNSATANRYFFALSSTAGGTVTPVGNAGVWLNPAGQLMISKNSSSTPATNTTPPLVVSNTYLVVLRYLVTGTNDEVALWLNPLSLGDNANIPPPTITTTNNANNSSFASIAYVALTGTPTNLFYMDEIRVNNNWAGVTPRTASPGPSYTVTRTGSGVGCPGDSFPVGLSGSVTTNVYLLYTNGVYSGAKVAGNGSAITFGPQVTTADYTVLASNEITSAVGWMTNSVSVAILGAPNITTEPNPATVATNGLAVFNVTASGDGLNYRWYRNGVALADGGNVSGAGTAVLIISPATAADAATAAQGYYCVITNSCGYSDISTTNSLTLGAPDNLVWQGGNPDAVWDLGITANFTNSAGAPVVFTSGNNVVFDDSSPYPVVTIAGSYISPALVAVRASQNYSFGGGGAIFGPSALLMDGAGVLTVSNVNAYTGVTTISNGTVKAQNLAGLGSSSVVLSGGTLEIPVVGSATAGLWNNIHVAANSTLQYDLNGTYACVLRGALTGNSGTTLNIFNWNNNPPAVSRMRLYGAFTNNANIALSTLGSTVEIAPYQSAGSNQVYNGVISGNGRFTLRGSGAVIFNRANTLSDGTYSVILSGGNLGLGIDSTYSTPPIIQSSPIGQNDLVIDATAGDGALFADGGPRTLGNGIRYSPIATNDTGSALYLSGSHNLTLSGPLQLTLASDPNGVTRILHVNNTNAATTLAGVIGDNGLGSGLTKNGEGALYLNANNTYTGTTTVNTGLLAGIGSVAGAVFVQEYGSIGGGSATSIGKLTINGSLTLRGGVFARVNKTLSPAQSNDMVSASGSVVNIGTGTVRVANIGSGPLAVGDKFRLFSGAVVSGGALSITGGGMNWTNQLAVDGSIVALSVASTVSTNPSPISIARSGTNVNLSWPSDHLGWTLLTNSVSVANFSSWHPYPGSELVTNVTINPVKTNVFFRLVYPYP